MMDERCVSMKRNKLTFEERQFASRLREEIIQGSQTFVNPRKEQLKAQEIEYISKNEQPYVSPIFSLNEDEILALVEGNDISVLSKLSVAELNYIGEVLGVEPKILVEGLD